MNCPCHNCDLQRVMLFLSGITFQLFIFLFLAEMSFHRRTWLWLREFFLHQTWFYQMWAEMIHRLELFFFFPWILTRVFCMWQPPPPQLILNHYIVVLYIFDKNDLMYWNYYCLKVIVSWEGIGEKKFILDTNEKKKIYVNSYKSLDINTDRWGTLLDCSLKFVHLFW